MPQTTNQQLIKAYHKEYIGKSAGLNAVADKYDTSPYTLKNLWLKNNLRLRNRSQAYAARQLDGKPWEWSDLQRPAAAKPPAPKSGPEPPTPEAETVEPEAEPLPEEQQPPEADSNHRPDPVEADPDPEPEPQPEEQQPPAANRSLILHTEDYHPKPPDRPLWLPGTNTNGYHSPTLADLAHLVRDLRAAGADVEINLNIALEVRQK